MKRTPMSFVFAYFLFFSLTTATFSCSKDSELLSEVIDIDTVTEVTEPKSTDSNPTGTVTDSTLIDTTTAVLPVGPDKNFPLNTELTITGNQFYINGRLTYEGRYWQGNKIEGLLMNSRMVQGIFDDLNPTTSKLFAYPDTNTWNANRNTDEFVMAMQEWKNNGLLAFTLNLQGGSPTGYNNAQAWLNSAFDENGGLRPAYMNRLQRILNKADELNMVVILGYFYFGQDQVLANEAAVINAVDNITDWILNEGYRNLLIEINNECDISAYNHAILRPTRVHELINRVKQKQKNGFRLLVSTSFKGGAVPTANVVQASDYLLLHGNGVSQPSGITSLINATRNVSGSGNKPIINNEDDHYNFDANENNFKASVQGYVSWGFFDFRRQGEAFSEGFQSVPVDWGINSSRKRDFFAKVKEITGY